MENVQSNSRIENLKPFPSSVVINEIPAQGATANFQWRKVSCDLSYDEQMGSWYLIMYIMEAVVPIYRIFMTELYSE
jgi:hypothetical protein